MESGTPVLACVAARSAQLRHQASGGQNSAASSSMGKSLEVLSRCSAIWTIVSNRKTSKNFEPSPLPAAPNVGEEILWPGGGVHPP
jgi:hypothetical protein